MGTSVAGPRAGSAASIQFCQPGGTMPLIWCAGNALCDVGCYVGNLIMLAWLCCKSFLCRHLGSCCLHLGPKPSSGDARTDAVSGLIICCTLPGVRSRLY